MKFCIRCGDPRGRRRVWCVRCLRDLLRANRRKGLVALGCVALLALASCDLSSTCEGSQRFTRLWNDTGTTNLILVDSDVIPTEDLPVTLIPDTNNQPGEDDGTDSISWTNTQPTGFYLDYRWGTGPVQHAEGTAPACP